MHWQCPVCNFLLCQHSSVHQPTYTFTTSRMLHSNKECFIQLNYILMFYFTKSTPSASFYYDFHMHFCRVHFPSVKCKQCIPCSLVLCFCSLGHSTNCPTNCHSATGAREHWSILGLISYQSAHHLPSPLCQCHSPRDHPHP